MATYHGIVRAKCLTCGRVVTDTATLEIWNDLDVGHDDCRAQLIEWVLENGTHTVTEHSPEGDLVNTYVLPSDADDFENDN